MRSIDLSPGTSAPSFIQRAAGVLQMFLPLGCLGRLKTKHISLCCYTLAPSILTHDDLDLRSIPMMQDSYMLTTARQQPRFLPSSIQFVFIINVLASTS